MDNVSTLETLVNWGFKKNPFKDKMLRTEDNTRIGRILAMGVQTHAMVSIVGERGSGKTMAVKEFLRKLRAMPVYVRSTDKRRVLITDIEQSIILDLSDEHPKRGREIRAHQLRRVLGQASRKYEIVLVLEESHQLHGMTLRSVKGLREIDWMGNTELFTVVLLGQSDPLNKAGMSEVKLRSDTVKIQGMTGIEINKYISSTVGRVFSKDAMELVSQLPDARNYLNLQSILITLMGHAFGAGSDQVLREHVETAYPALAATGKESSVDSAKLKSALDSLDGNTDKKPRLQAVGGKGE